VRASRVTGRAGLPPEIEAQAAALDARWAERGVPAMAMPVELSKSGRVNVSVPGALVEYSKTFGLAWENRSG
jgi:hypothetical protein